MKIMIMIINIRVIFNVICSLRDHYQGYHIDHHDNRDNNDHNDHDDQGDIQQNDQTVHDDDNHANYDHNDHDDHQGDLQRDLQPGDNIWINCVRIITLIVDHYQDYHIY